MGTWCCTCYEIGSVSSVRLLFVLSEKNGVTALHLAREINDAKPSLALFLETLKGERRETGHFVRFLQTDTALNLRNLSAEGRREKGLS